MIKSNLGYHSPEEDCFSTGLSFRIVSDVVGNRKFSPLYLAVRQPVQKGNCSYVSHGSSTLINPNYPFNLDLNVTSVLYMKLTTDQKIALESLSRSA